MRTFIAIELDSDVKRRIMKASEKVRNELKGVKWVERQNLHITLKFLGEVNKEQIEKLKKVIDEISSQQQKFKISGGYLGAFPSLERARVVFFGIESGKASVIRIFEVLERKLVKNGFLKDNRPYHPHITIGRAKRRFFDLKPYKGTKVGFEYEVRSIVLYKSTLRPEGPIYEVIHRGELR